MSAASRRPPDILLDIEDMTQRLDALERALLAPTYLVSDLPARGIVLRSPNGHYWRVTVDDAGSVVATDLGTTKPT